MSENSQNKLGVIITKKLEIDFELFESWMITALEGGSNYWYFIKSLPKRDDLKGLAFSEALSTLVWKHDEKIEVFDIENQDEEPLGVIEKSKVVATLQKLSKENNEVFVNLTSENYDAMDCDIFFQVLVMDEITFG
jgi:hypothetical protein